jgi:Ca2+-binding RTX toxin-like protein
MSKTYLPEILKTVDAIKSGVELGNSTMVAADVAKLTAQLAAGFVVESGLRTYSALDGLGRTLSLWRLDMAIMGKPIAGYQALAGFVASEAVGKLIDGIRDLNLGSRLYDMVNSEDDIQQSVNNFYTAAKNWQPPRDPLVLDLDGDGIETVGIFGAAGAGASSSPILFDHDADSIRTGTGWIKADDALLVRDLNGNGTIDSGRELFGDNTLLPNNTRASNGYTALAQHDTNADGQINSQDAIYSQLKIWRDLNQDGTSQAGELQTLQQAGIASIGVQGTATNTNLVDSRGQATGNTQIASGSFTRTDGGTGASGVAELSGSLLLGSNNFYREFTDNPSLTTQAKAQPQMQGSGWVRDLREAMSLGTSKAAALGASVSAFAAGTTRAQQLNAVDQLLKDWAGSSGQTVTSVYRYNMVAGADGRLVTSNLVSSSVGNVVLTLNPQGMTTTVNSPTLGAQTAITPEGELLLRRLNVLEAFNGDKFLQLAPLPPAQPGLGVSAGGGSGAAAIATATLVTATLSGPQIDLINASYNALRESVYGALVVQTRLRPYIDSIQLVIDSAGISFDTSAVAASLEAKRTANPSLALDDLAELARFASPTLDAAGFDAVNQLRTWLGALAPTDPLRVQATALNVFFAEAGSGTAGGDVFVGSAADNSFSAGNGDDVLDGGAGVDNLVGGEGNDTVRGGVGDDYLDGGAGNDSMQGGAGVDNLVGGEGNDNLDGGEGNDTMQGGNGADTYRFGRGSGQDTIYNYDSDALGTNLDTIQLGAGIATTDVTLNRSGDTLVVRINGTEDSLSVSGYFTTDGTTNSAVERLRFADGTVWNVATVKVKALIPSEGNDTLTGYATADTINAGGGNDTVYGQAGDDVLDGGEGNDGLYGGEGNDTVRGGVGDDYLDGGAGNDSMQGGAGVDNLVGGEGNDNLDGGEGNDTMQGGNGADTYRFGRGSGQDTISNYDGDALGTNLDTIQLGAGVAANQLWLRQIGSDLEISIIGSTDKSVISNWYSGSTYRVEQFKTSDGKLLLDSQVDALVSAMAAFAPPAAGQTTLPADYQTALNPVIAANWK